MALRAGGRAPNITAFVLRESVTLVSGQYGVPQWPGTTRLSRGIFQQRGHVSPPVAALGGNGTSPLDPVRCSVVSASGHGGVPPCPRSTRLSRGVRGSCGTRPLRQNYIMPHCIKCRSSHSQAHFVSPHRFAPSGFTQQALCKIAFAGAVASRLHSPVATRPTCSRLSPLWCAGVVAYIRRFAHGSGRRLRRASCVSPRPPLGLASFAASPARSARPPPKGAPSEPRQDTPPDDSCNGHLYWPLVYRQDLLTYTHYSLQLPGVARSSFATATLPCSSGIDSSPAPPTNIPILMYCRIK